jgi:hypothetical protein
MHCDGVIFSHIGKIGSDGRAWHASPTSTFATRSCVAKKTMGFGQCSPDFGNGDHHLLPSTTPPTSIWTHGYWEGTSAKPESFDIER